MSNLTTTHTNPYVGPRTFQPAERDRFFGREREARDLHSLVVAERLTLFYAQSGAGKSSLLNTRLIPSLQAAGFLVLPVARVSGKPPAGVGAINNLFVYNLLLRLDQSEGDPARFTGMSLSHFLANLTSDDGEQFYYSTEELNITMTPAVEQAEERPTPVDYATPPHILIIDQFEEILSTHLDRWRERTDFFRQLEATMQADPLLWVVLVLREDYLAALDPYAPLLTGNLRARYYMERLGADAALAAIKNPAANAGRPFTDEAAQALVKNLCQVRVAGQEGTFAGQYVEPVQLQVVCYQLWENLNQGRITEADVSPLITSNDLQQAGDVDTALINFYEQALATALALPGVNISQRQLRTWFDKQLITAAYTRGVAYRGVTETADMDNRVVDALQARFLLRSEMRAGGTWVELVHDRFVEPILRANSAWRAAYYNPLAVACERWREGGRTDERLLRGDNLHEAITFATKNPADITEEERIFLQRSQRVAKQRLHQLQLFIGGTVVVLLLFAGLAWYGLDRATAARQAQAKAEASADLANQQLARLEGLNLLRQAEQFSAVGKIEEAMAAYKKAVAADPTVDIDLSTVTKKVYRQAAFLQVQEGEQLAAQGKLKEASAKFQAALALNPPPSTPLYIWIPPGEFRMGAVDSDLAATDVEKPQHDLFLPGFWIMTTEVTNIQYRSCVNSGRCEPPANNRYLKPLLDDWPVTNISWNQALTYANWVGGRLPTEAEWEKACRGTDTRIFPWGNRPPSPQLLNFGSSDGIWTTVGTYPEGKSFYGLMDMAGSVIEWTSTLWGSGEDVLWTPDFLYPYQSDDGREATDAPAEVYRVVRNGAFDNSDIGVFRCTFKQGQPPSTLDIRIGFRVVSSAAPP